MMMRMRRWRLASQVRQQLLECRILDFATRFPSRYLDQLPCASVLPSVSPQQSIQHLSRVLLDTF